MLIERPHTDKIRFVDSEVMNDDSAYIHTIEVSDERSKAHFITVFTKGKETPLQQMDDMAPHDPDIYHRDDEGCFWVNRHFKRGLNKGWTHHYHWRYQVPVHLYHVIGVLDRLGSGARGDFKDYVRGFYANAGCGTGNTESQFGQECQT